MNSMTNGVTITIVSTGESYHTLRDWGLAIGNNDCIGSPIVETFYLDVPGADGFLDYSEALTGRPIFKERPIRILLGGKMSRSRWAGFMSSIRILLHGKQVQLVFDDFPGYYWQGRAEIKEYNRTRGLATFELSIPKADPYGYSLNDNSTEDWLWDPFDFELGVIDDPVNITLTDAVPTYTYTIPHSVVPFKATITASTVGDMGITMAAGEDSFALLANLPVELLVTDSDLPVTFTGRGTLQVVFRRRVI